VKKLLLLIPIIVLIIGCGGDDVTNYFPLTVGNEWNYDMTMTMTDPDTTTTETGTVELEITAETTLDNGTEVFEMIMIMTEITTFADTSYIEETEDYLLQYSNKAATVPNDTMLALPLETGKTWADCEVMGKKDITVPAETFKDCWEIRGIDNSDTMYMYLAPDVGMVKMSQKVAETDTTSYEMLMELETYTVK
jgi:hypothetical protein